MKNLFTILVLFVTVFSMAQEKGTLQGKVLDKEAGNEPLPFANVFVKGTQSGTTTDMDGVYLFTAAPGTYTLVVSFVGYETIEIPNVVIKAGQVTTLENVVLGPNQGVALKEVVVKASTKKESVAALLADQKKAVEIKESIGAIELSNKGISDAAAATEKVSGVAKQEGSNKVYVRGLGDRYNTTTLNGMPLPSNDPSNKNISLDLFTTDIIQNIGVRKSFSSKISGDVAGANIDITTKELSGKGGVTVGISSGFNTQTTGKDFKNIDGANWFGISKNTTHPVTSLQRVPFSDNFSPNDGKANLPIGLSISGGKKFDIGEESNLSVFLVGSFDNNYEYRDGISINYLREDGATGSNYTSAQEYQYSTSKLLMGNFIYKINSNNSISYNSMLIQSNSQKVQDYYGKKPDVADSENEFANIVLQTENQNTLLVNQLLSKHKIGDSFDVNLGLSYNTVNNDEPNRKKNIFKVDTQANTVTFASGTGRNNSRYFHNLKENDLTAKADVRKYFGTRDSEEHKISLDFGVEFRKTNRDMDQYYFDYDIQNATTTVDRNNVNSVLSQQGLDNGTFRLITHFGRSDDALDPMFYKGEKTTLAGYSSLNYKVSEKLFINGGLRFESLKMDVNWRTPQAKSGGKTDIEKTYVLPSLNLKYNFTEDNLLRLSASQTYTFPQFKEIAPFPYEEVDKTITGNPNLKPSTNYNIDLKWELYPKKGELISASIFTKMIKDAINRVELAAASDGFYSYGNTGDAEAYGIEVELRKNIADFHTEEDDFEKTLQLGFNGAYMYTNQTLTPTSQFIPTNTEEQLEGASPFIINADITYKHKVDDKQTLASLVFNYQDDKLFTVGANLLQPIFQESVPRLDFIFKRQFNKKLGLKFGAKNLLNPKFERYREVSGEPVMRSYQRGINLSLGFTYKL